MKSNLLIVILFCLGNSLFGQAPMITEISYDNNYDQNDYYGIDSIEFVEIYINDPQPTDPAAFKIATYNNSPSGGSGPGTNAEVGFVRDLSDAITTGNTPNGMYYVIEFVDSTFYGFPSAGIHDGYDGVALVEMGSPNIVHDFWRYETCVPFTAVNGPAAGATSLPITTDRSRVCGSSGVYLVQMNSAMSTTLSIQQNGFGDWEVGLASANSSSYTYENSNNVPVDLLFFKAVAKDENVQLTWATAQESSNDFFSVLHSTDGRLFNEIGTVTGRGDSNDKSSYDFTVEDLRSGQHYFKLRQIDFDGRYKEFEIRSVKIANDNIALYPSLATNEITLTNVENGAIFQLFDVQGQLMKEEIYESTINVSGLKSGAYILKVNETALRFVKN